MSKIQVTELTNQSQSRSEFWINFINYHGIEHIVEIGVFQGEFSAQVLQACKTVKKYYMIDPWRNLRDWNKPLNVDDNTFQQVFNEAMQRTDFAVEKRIVLKGKTTEVIDKIADHSLDFAYIDGDHTLRGIAVDLIRTYPKIMDGGWIGGDDFCESIWQHPETYEPTLIFPFAVYFAEAVSARIYALPFRQFLIEKSAGSSYEFIDLTGKYGNTGMQNQLARKNL